MACRTCWVTRTRATRERLGQDLGVPEGPRQYVNNYPPGRPGHLEHGGRHLAMIRPPPVGHQPRALGTEPRRSRPRRSTTSPGSRMPTTPSFPRPVRRQMSAILNLLQYVLTPEVNAMAYDTGYFYPGPPSRARPWTRRRRQPGHHQGVRPRLVRRLIDKAPKATPLTPPTWSRPLTGGTVRSVPGSTRRRNNHDYCCQQVRVAGTSGVGRSFGGTDALVDLN